MELPSTSLWPPIKHELSLDLLHAIIKDKKQITATNLRKYLLHVCGIVDGKNCLNAIFGLNEPKWEDALKVGLSGIATVKGGLISYNEECERPLPISAHPSEDIFLTILSLIRRNARMTVESLVDICRKELQIEVTIEKLNALFGEEFHTFHAALEYGYRDYALFFKSTSLGEKITYLGPGKASGEVKRQALYTKVKDSIIELIQAQENIYEVGLKKAIFEKHGVLLSDKTVKEIFNVECDERGFNKLWSFKQGLKEHAVVVYAPLMKGSAVSQCVLFRCIGKPCQESLLRASKLKPFVLLHDGCATHVESDERFRGSNFWLSWHYTDRAQKAEIIECIKSQDWSDVRGVVLAQGVHALRKETPLLDIVKDLCSLMETIREAASKNCEFHIVSLPLYPDPARRAPNAEKLNDLFKTMTRTAMDYDFNMCYCDINELLLQTKIKEVWRESDGYAPYVPVLTYHEVLLGYMKKWKKSKSLT